MGECPKKISICEGDGNWGVQTYSPQNVKLKKQKMNIELRKLLTNLKKRIVVT